MCRPFFRRGKAAPRPKRSPVLHRLGGCQSGHGSPVAVIPQSRKSADFSPVIVDSRWPFLKIIVASHSRYQSRLKVAEESPESRKTSGGIFIVAGSKSLAYFASSASMILSASAPYTSSRYFRRSSSGEVASPRGLFGVIITSCWSLMP